MNRRMMTKEDIPKRVEKIWNQWEIRVMVLLSLILQIVLITCGNRRKYTVRTTIGVIIWIAYLVADSVATISLGIISHSQQNSHNNVSSTGPNPAILALWAPFLLVHLGGPDTITAYAVQDNELWLRHLVGLLVQVGGALYIFKNSWSSDNALAFVAIPMFIPGIFKYGERTWALWSASRERFRHVLLGPPEPGPDYEELVEKLNARTRDQQFGERHIEVDGESMVQQPNNQIERAYSAERINPEAKLLAEAYFLFDMFKRLYADLSPTFHEGEDGFALLWKKSSEDAFRMIEIELGFMYDLLYTKASIAHSRTGVALRSISFLSSAAAFVAFWIAIDKHKHNYPDVDVAITYVLLSGAIFIEIYAGIILICSEWTLLYLIKLKEGIMVNFIYRAISSTPTASINRERWCGSMAQFNLIGSCLKDRQPANIQAIKKFFQIHGTLKKVTIDLKELIFRELQQKIATFLPDNDVKQLRHKKGDYVLENKSCLDKFKWSVVEVEFDHSMLLWHIATDLCYYSDHNKNSKREISKSLSDYMLYLLIMRPLMLPKGDGQIRYRDTCAEARRFIQQRRKSISRSRSEVCKRLLQVKTDIPSNEVKGDKSKSVLFDACRLAKSLQSLETEENWQNEEKWEMITQVWIEMLCYAAIQCRWNDHVRPLTQGGELLTHVCLLMAHLGLGEQFQISERNARITLPFSRFL